MALKVTTLQRVQLIILTCAHFAVDIFAGILPAILPAVMLAFSINLSRSVVVLTVLNLSCNFMQMLTGYLRQNNKQPFFVYLGLLSAPAICFIALLPANPQSYPVMLLLAFITGCGVAMVHPETLKSVHHLKRISSAMGTSLFLSGGFLGYSFAGFISAALVSSFGLKGLFFLLICPLASVVSIACFKIRVAVEPQTKPADGLTNQNNTIGFWPIAAMTVAATSTVAILTGLIPTRLHQLGFDLKFGGLSAMVLGLSGSLGPFVWSLLAKKYSEIKCIAIALIIGTPFLIAYLHLMQSAFALLLLAAAGLTATSAYPLMISMARHARGMKLGPRMAFIIGGAWGPASLLLLASGYAAEHFGLQKVLNLTPIGYAAASVVAVAILFRKIKVTATV